MERRVIVVTGDVSKQEDVGRVLDHIGKHCAPLKGVFHAAMVLDDDLLVRLDSARVAEVLAPKVAGAWNLHRLTAGLELDHFVLFSSATSLFGHQGQGSYSAANAFLDALAPYRRAAGRPCTTINWGAISGAGYVSRNADVGKYLAWSGLAGFGADEAVSALEIILRRDLTNVMAARVDWTMWAQRISGIAASKPFVRFAWRAGLRGEQRQEDGGFLAALQAAPDDEREELLEDLVVQRVAKVCASSPGKIDRDLPLTDMGFDSLMTVELQTALKRDFGTQLPIVDLLEGVSVRQLVSSLLDRLRPGTAAVRAALPEEPEPAAAAVAAAPRRRSHAPARPPFLPLRRPSPHGWARTVPVRSRSSSAGSGSWTVSIRAPRLATFMRRNGWPASSTPTPSGRPWPRSRAATMCSAPRSPWSMGIPSRYSGRRLRHISRSSISPMARRRRGRSKRPEPPAC